MKSFNIIKKLSIIVTEIKVFYYTAILRAICKIKVIRIGKGCKFHGLMKFHRYNYSIIRIGSCCTFRSSYSSNLLGLNHPCIIATHSSEAVINIGNNCGFSGSVIGAFKNITIGNNVRCGANTTITDSDWHRDDQRSGEPKSVIIEDNVWLGLNVIVLKGVTIGKNTVIGAGSVITKNIPPNVIAAGNPCKVIRPLNVIRA